MAKSSYAIYRSTNQYIRVLPADTTFSVVALSHPEGDGVTQKSSKVTITRAMEDSTKLAEFLKNLKADTSVYLLNHNSKDFTLMEWQFVFKACRNDPAQFSLQWDTMEITNTGFARIQPCGTGKRESNPDRYFRCFELNPLGSQRTLWFEEGRFPIDIKNLPKLVPLLDKPKPPPPKSPSPPPPETHELTSGSDDSEDSDFDGGVEDDAPKHIVGEPPRKLIKLAGDATHFTVPFLVLVDPHTYVGHVIDPMPPVHSFFPIGSPLILEEPIGPFSEPFSPSFALDISFPHGKGPLEV